MITVPQAAKYIEARESRRLKWYFDSEKHPTVGVGFNLDRAGADQSLKAIGVTKAQIMRGRLLTHAEVDTLLANDVAACLDAAMRHVPNFGTQPEEVQLILVDLVFNLGLTRFARFKQFLYFIRHGSYARAAGELMFKAPPKPELTAYFTQTKTRAIGHIATLHGLART